jgi:sugar phosphate isomerase/epimerase
MKTSINLNRRRFLQTGIVGSAALAGHFTAPQAAASLTKPEGDPFHGLKMGVTSYTFQKFMLDQALAMTKEAGVKYISLKDMHLPMKSSRAEREEARRKVQEAGLTLMGGGVIYMKNNEAEIRAAFDYAKDAGMPTIICSPDPEALDIVEKMAKEYGIRIAIHNHGPGDKKYPSPLDVLRLVKDRDKLMGLCMDVGHTVRIGQEPISAIEQCAERLYDFHMKDVTEATAKGKATEVGRGVIDIVGVLKALIRVKYSYQVALEYETKATAPMPGVIESFAYMRGVLAVV